MLSMEEIYQHHAQTVYRYLLTLTYDTHVAEELTQETFYQAVKNVERFDGSCAVSTWLCGIAKNVLRTYRRKHPVLENLTDIDVPFPSPEEKIVSSDERLTLLRQLHELNIETREVMYLRLFGDLSFREIGEVLSKSENWARVTFYRGKEKLRKDLSKYGE